MTAASKSPSTGKQKQQHQQYITASIVPKNDQGDDEFA
jgi:hypothetical protein